MTIHTIFGNNPVATPDNALVVASDGDSVYRIGTLFYTSGAGVDGWRCSGARIYIVDGGVGGMANSITLSLWVEPTIDVDTLSTVPLRTGTVDTSTGRPGWFEVTWDPVVVTSGQKFMVAYESGVNKYQYVAGSSAAPYDTSIQAADGSNLYLSESYPVRGYFYQINGGARSGFNFYSGLDVIMDDGAAGPLAAYGFNETSGVTAVDATTSGHDLTVNSASNFDVSREGNGLHQVGDGSSYKISNAAPWLETAQRSIMFWGRLGSVGAATSSRTVYQTNATSETVFGVSMSDGSSASVTVRIGNVPVTLTAPQQAVGDWHHYTLTYDGVTVSLYIDAILAASQSATGAIDASDGNLYLYGEDYQQQVIDDLRLFDRAVTPSEATTYMNTVITAPDLTPPTMPGNVTSSVVYQQVTLSWDASTDDIAVQNYVVYRSTTSGFTPAPGNQVGGPNVTNYVGSAPVGTHYYRVAARDEAGNESTASAEIQVVATVNPSSDYLYPSGLGWEIGTAYTDPKPQGQTLGVLFATEVPVPIKGLRYYSPVAVSGCEIRLYEETDERAVKTGVSLSAGWNTVNFDVPYIATSGVSYVGAISLPGPSQSYTAIPGKFSNTKTSVGPLYSMNPDAGRFGDGAGYPMGSSAAWYGVDIIADSQSGPIDTGFGTDIVTENAKPGSNGAGWTISGAGDKTNLGFAREFSVNVGETINFSCHGDGTILDIYRIGSYGGIGWRKVVSLINTATIQPDPVVIPNSNGGAACTNWSTTASWTVPSTAISGLFVGVYRNSAHDNASYIPFCVRDDAKPVDLVVKLSDTTWALAYNYYGTPASPLTGKSVYGSGGPLGDITTRAHAGSYHRPIVTREGIPQTYWLNCEAPLIRFIESNGLNVKYVASKDVDANPAVLQPSKMAVSSGHDEYWSEGMRDAFAAYRDAGGHVLFMSGNEVFWRVRFSPDHSMMWVYKDTMSGPGTHVGGAPLDPVSWTGTWKDTRWAGNQPEKGITGTDFRMNGVSDNNVTLDHTAGYATHPFWRGTDVATGTSVAVQGIVGFEADEIAPTQPAESTAVLAQYTFNIDGARADDNGESYNGNGDLNWGVVSQRYASGAVVVGFGTCQWAWGLDNTHDRGGGYANTTIQQATLNLFADLGAEPVTTSAWLTAPTPLATLDSYGLIPAVGGRSGSVKVWDGTTWQSHPLKVWDGTDWVTRRASGHDGTSFIEGK